MLNWKNEERELFTVKLFLSSSAKPEQHIFFFMSKAEFKKFFQTL